MEKEIQSLFAAIAKAETIQQLEQLNIDYAKKRLRELTGRDWPNVLVLKDTTKAEFDGINYADKISELTIVQRKSRGDLL